MTECKHESFTVVDGVAVCLLCNRQIDELSDIARQIEWIESTP